MSVVTIKTFEINKAPNQVVVFKYPNRKLYISSLIQELPVGVRARYVNCQDLRAMIKEGLSLVVVSQPDNQDVTRAQLASILTQNIEENLKVKTTAELEAMVRGG